MRSSLGMHSAWWDSHKEHRSAAKKGDDGEGEEGKKKRSGIQIPEEWPWEEAKKLFENPDVTPADQISVSTFVSFCQGGSNMLRSSSGKNQTWRGWSISLSERRGSCMSL